MLKPSSSFQVVLRSPYSYDVMLASNESALDCLDKTLAKQEFAEECDINTIIKRFGIGYEPPVGLKVPFNSEFEDIIDFQTAMQLVTESREAFMEMSADTRARFGNDPGAFVNFCSNPDNAAEMLKLGLIVERPGAPVVLVKEVAPVAATAAAAAPQKGG